MNPGPPHLLETIVSLLIPPASREHVLGDLHERYRNPWQYAADAACAVPLVIFSRIRRTTDVQVLLIEACTLYLSFLAAAWRLDGAAFLFDESGFSRLAIPAFASLAASLLANAYGNPSLPYAPVRDAAIGAVCAFLSQAAVAVINPDLLIHGLTMLSGAGVGLLLASTVRALFAPGQFAPALPKALVETDSKRDPKRNSEAILLGLIAVPAVALLLGADPRLAIPCGVLLIVGVRSFRSPYTGLGWLFYTALAVILVYWAALRSRREARR